ncbi:MAG: hybrid sensor histidine kinase/response regulator [Bacillota bacterium]
MQNAEFLKDFQEEADAHLRLIEKNILLLDSTGFVEETVRELFRSAHSIKGMAGFFALAEIVAVAHSLEELFSRWRDGKRIEAGNVVDVILAANDLLKTMINAPEQSIGTNISDCLALVNELTAATSAAEAPNTAVPITTSMDATTSPPEVVKAVEAVVFSDNFVRVSTQLLDELIAVAGEITMLRNRLAQILAANSVDLIAANSVTENIGKAVFVLQNTVMQMRMQPLDELFSRFPRVVRDLSKRTGKKVSLEVSGADTEIDKQVAEALYDPLMHLLRNCLDHGIETAAQREQSGKPAVGTVALRAYNAGGNVYIEVVDDGRGIDAESVRGQIVKRGLLSEIQAATLSFAELVDYLFMPGFSTAAVVTDISGRGVGLDVVRTNIERLGGTVEALSQKNAGTTFRLKLPLTLAVMKALLVRIASAIIAIPQSVVLEAARYNNSQQLEYISGRMFWNLREELVPVIDLSQLLGMTATIAPLDYLVFVESAGRRYGFFVDEALDTEDVLVRKLPGSLSGLSCYESLVLLADGVIAPVLNVADIIERAALGDSNIEEITGKKQDYQYQPPQQKLLVFECEKTGRYAVDMSSASGVYRADASRFSMLDGELFVNLADKIFRVLTVDNQLPDLSNQQYIIALSANTGVSYAIIASNIIDFMTQPVEFTGHLDNFGIYYGTALIGDELTPVVNAHCLLNRAAGQLFGSLAGAGEKRMILVVEPDDYCARIIKYFLDIAGFNSIIVATGEQALERVRADKFAAALIAEMLPDMSGVNLFRSIKGDKRLLWLPCARLKNFTAASEDAHSSAFADDDFDGVVWKYDLHGLVEPLTAMLEGAKW